MSNVKDPEKRSSNKATIKSLASYHKHAERNKATMLDRLQTPRGRAMRLMGSIRKRSKEKGMKFDITLDWLEERLASGVCQVTGLPFDFSPGRSPYSPSIDKIDPSKAYTQDNAQVVLWMYNAAKGHWNHEDVVRMANALVIHR